MCKSSLTVAPTENTPVVGFIARYNEGKFHGENVDVSVSGCLSKWVGSLFWGLRLDRVIWGGSGVCSRLGTVRSLSTRGLKKLC